MMNDSSRRRVIPSSSDDDTQDASSTQNVRFGFEDSQTEDMTDFLHRNLALASQQWPDFKNWAPISDHEEKARLIGMLEQFISSEGITHHTMLWNVLSKWNNMARLDSLGLNRFRWTLSGLNAEPTLAAAAPNKMKHLNMYRSGAGDKEDEKIYLHYDWMTGCLLIVDLVHEKLLSVCWLEKCTRQSGGNRYLLCFNCVEKYVALYMRPCKTVEKSGLLVPKYKSRPSTDTSIYSDDFAQHEKTRTAFLQLIFVVIKKRTVCPAHDRLHVHLELCKVYLQRFPVFIYKDIAITYSYAVHDLIFRTAAFPTWKRKCSKIPDCFHPTIPMTSYCYCHMDKETTLSTIFDIVLRYSGAPDWQSISKPHIQHLKMRLYENWKSERSAHFRVYVDEDDVIYARMRREIYIVCDNFVGECKTIYPKQACCPSCFKLKYYFPSIIFDKTQETLIRLTGIRAASVHRVVKPTMEENVKGCKTVYKKAGDWDSRSELIGIIDTDTDEPLTQDEMHSWTIAFLMYARLEGDLCRIRDIKYDKTRTNIGPFVIRYFLNFLKRAGIEMVVKNEYVPIDTRTGQLFTLGPKIGKSDFRPTVYLATNVEKNSSYVGLLARTPVNAKKTEQDGYVVAGVHARDNDPTRYTRVFGPTTEPGVRREVTVAQQITGTNAYEMETIVILASLFASKLFRTPSVENAQTSTCSFTYLSFFEEFRRTLFHLSGKTIKFNTATFKPFLFCLPAFKGTDYEILRT